MIRRIDKLIRRGGRVGLLVSKFEISMHGDPCCRSFLDGPIIEVHTFAIQEMILNSRNRKSVVYDAIKVQHKNIEAPSEM